VNVQWKILWAVQIFAPSGLQETTVTVNANKLCVLQSHVQMEQSGTLSTAAAKLKKLPVKMAHLLMLLVIVLRIFAVSLDHAQTI